MCVLKNYLSPMDYFINARSQLSNDFMTSSVPCFLLLLFCFFQPRFFFYLTDSPYVTGFGKRDLIAQIMIFLYRRFSATTPKNNSRDKTFVFVSEVSPTLCLHSR